MASSIGGRPRGFSPPQPPVIRKVLWAEGALFPRKQESREIEKE